MKTRNLFLTSAFAVSLCFAAEEAAPEAEAAQPNVVESCYAAIDNATKDIPANVVAFGSPCKVYREINEHDEEYYFRDRRFDEQPSREEKDIPHLDFWEK